MHSTASSGVKGVMHPFSPLDKYSLEHRAAHALGHLVYVHISCISRGSYALWDSYHALWKKYYTILL